MDEPSADPSRQRDGGTAGPDGLLDEQAVIRDDLTVALLTFDAVQNAENCPRELREAAAIAQSRLWRAVGQLHLRGSTLR